MNDESWRKYDSIIRFKTSMIRSGVCDCSDAYLLLSGIITITGEEAGENAKSADERIEE